MTIELNKTTRTDMYKIDPRTVSFDPKDNPRKNYGDMESLKSYIRDNGTQSLPPIIVRKNKDSDEGVESYSLIHGFRRMTAITALLAEGVDIARLVARVVPKNYSKEDELVDHLNQNEGKALTVYEKACIYNQLEKNGWSQAEIAKKVGKTQSYISNMLKVMSCSKKVHNALDEEIISTSLVLDIMAKYGDQADEVIFKAIATAKTFGKFRVTKKLVGHAVSSDEELTPLVTKATKIQKAFMYALEKEAEPMDIDNIDIDEEDFETPDITGMPVNVERMAKLIKAKTIIDVIEMYKAKPEELVEKLVELI